MTRTKIQTVFFAMGTAIILTVFDQRDEEAVRAAKCRVLELHKKWNAFDPDSELSRIRFAAGTAYASVSRDTVSILERCAALSVLTDGCFDVTAGPICMLWKQALSQKTFPQKEDIRRAAALTDYRDIRIDRENSAVMLRRNGQSIDLGAVAKGYAADEVRRILTENGVREAVVNLGGTVVVIGAEKRVGIQNPFRKTGTPFASTSVCDRALVSSGIYEQNKTISGASVHHLIDPKTGYPAHSEIAGITLIGGNAADMDALATATFVMPESHTRALLHQYSIDAVAVTKDGKILASDGVRDKIEIFQQEG